MLSVPAFQQRFREFSQTDPTLIGTVIAEAQRAVAPSIWCELNDDGVGYLAAHLLADDPAGTSTARIDKPVDGDPYSRTTYGVRFRELRTTVTAFCIGVGC